MKPRLRLPASPLGRVIALIPDSDREAFCFSDELKVSYFLAGEKRASPLYFRSRRRSSLFCSCNSSSVWVPESDPELGPKGGFSAREVELWVRFFVLLGIINK